MEKIYEYPNLGMDQNNELTNLNWPPPTLLTEAEDSIWISKDGEIERISHNNSLGKINEHPPLLCNSKATIFRLKCKPFLCFDTLFNAFLKHVSFFKFFSNKIKNISLNKIKNQKESTKTCLKQCWDAFTAKFGCAISRILT